MKYIASITVGSSNNNFEKEIVVNGEKIRISQYGSGHNTQAMFELALKLDGKADIIAIDGIPSIGDISKDPFRIKLGGAIKESKLTFGDIFTATYIPSALNRLMRDEEHLFTKKRIGFVSALHGQHYLQSLGNYTKRVCSLDPYIYFKIPTYLKNLSKINNFLGKFSSITSFLEANPSFKSTAKVKIDNDVFDGFKDSELFVIGEIALDFIEHEFLKGKTIISSVVSSEYDQKLRDLEVSRFISLTPNVYNIPHSNYSILEAILMVTSSDNLEEITIDIVAKWIDQNKIRPIITEVNNRPKSSSSEHFAFIIHPLSSSYLFKAPGLGILKPFQKELGPLVEKLAGAAPGMNYGHMSGIKSISTGKEITGTIYTVFETPAMMMKTDTEKMYTKLVNICKKAERDGANIIGLGAYTKVIGDGGVTINKRSPIPLTTGNSLSTASTLWAAKECVKKMGFVKTDGPTKTVSGTAMVIGATGSIGSVTAKILAGIFTNVIVVAPRPYKLMELSEYISEHNPECNLTVATNGDQYLSSCDMIITTTSANGKKIIDIMQVRPGCVICDVSRPFDISKEDTLKRPDVLVLANGEVELPGDVNISCDLGLTGNVVYACLAETALLALEGKLETFTISKEISMSKVKEIYKLAKKHGVKLAQITGPLGDITDQEIDLCREHAKTKREEINLETK